MCLKMVHKHTQVITRGYKIVRRVGYDKYQALHLGARFKIGTLHRANTSARIYAEDGTCYNSGFHAYVDLSGKVKKIAHGLGRVIMRVELEGVTASGRQNGVKCVVAKRMRMLGEVKQ